MILDTILSHMKKGSLKWSNSTPTQNDMKHIMKEGQENTPFDPSLQNQEGKESLRMTVLKDYQLGKAQLITRTAHNVKVLALVYPGTKINWDLIGRIFYAFGKPSNGIWRVVWFANKTKRILPKHGEPGPEHLNGGYAYACAPETIVIYREEEIYRVLIHELLHAACTDDMNKPVDIREVLTETWAEIFLACILSKGYKKRAEELLQEQLQWVSNQEYELVKRGVKRKSYAWRYTVGRSDVFRSLGFSVPPPLPLTQNSLRFTSPLLE